MNFKTTLILLVVLVGAGIGVYFTSKTAPTDQTASDTTPTPKKFLNLTTADVQQLTIEPSNGKRIVLKRDGINWHMLEPVDAPAETNPPSEILSDLEAMTSSGHVSASGADASATGLSPPQFKLEMTTKDGRSTRLDIGSRSGTGDQLYVHLDGQEQDDLVQADIYDLLDKPVSDFRRKKLLDVDTSQVQRVEVDRPEGKLVLQKFGTNWVIKQPSIMPADTSAVTDLIMGLTGLTANDFITETDPDPRRYGLDEPSIQVTFSTTPPSTQSATQASTQSTTDENERTVKFGMLDVRKQYAYVSTSDGTAVARVTVGSMDAFKKTALDLRDKNVLDIDPQSVSTISIHTVLPATTQPTTRPASDKLLTLDRRPLASTSPSTMPTSMPTTGPGTSASTQPEVKHSVWELSSTSPPIDAADGKVDALLSALHPLKVTQYNNIPTTAPATADRYTITIQCPPPLLSNYQINLIDPGNSSPLIGSYNDLSFQVDRSLLDKIKADFTHPDATPTTPAPSPAGFPTGLPGGGPAAGPSGP